jgi:hypothetical protein
VIAEVAARRCADHRQYAGTARPSTPINRQHPGVREFTRLITGDGWIASLVRCAMVCFGV